MSSTTADKEADLKDEAVDEVDKRPISSRSDIKVPSLAEQAQHEIERLGAALSLPKILNILKDKYPNPSADDVWIGSYLSSRLRTLFENPSMVGNRDGIHGSNSIVETVFTTIVEYLREKPNSEMEEMVVTEPLSDIPELEEKHLIAPDEADCVPPEGWVMLPGETDCDLKVD
ncbi:hypothetical protein BX600DRAFT_439485 [Xylariales sp. PMI_506]|nr:hypothetical protein BX600DRAFT_439485 [Xylariales sp. PMI_506]